MRFSPAPILLMLALVGPACRGEDDFAGGKAITFRIEAKHRDKAVLVVRKRLKEVGMTRYAVEPVGEDRYVVKIRWEEDLAAARELASSAGRLEFRLTVEPDAEHYEAHWQAFQKTKVRNLEVGGRKLRWFPLAKKAKENFQKTRLPGDGAPWVLCEIDKHNVTGADFVAANYRRNTEGLGGDWLVTFDVKKDAQRRMAALTKTEGRYLAIIFNDEVDSAPVLNSQLTTSGQISGAYTEAQARALAAVLKAGELEAKPKLIEEKTIGKDRADR